VRLGEIEEKKVAKVPLRDSPAGQTLQQKYISDSLARPAATSYSFPMKKQSINQRLDRIFT